MSKYKRGDLIRYNFVNHPGVSELMLVLGMVDGDQCLEGPSGRCYRMRCLRDGYENNTQIYTIDDAPNVSLVARGQ
jgi:hypothetical protein